MLDSFLVIWCVCHWLGFLKADEKIFGVQAIYKGSTPVEGRDRKQDWAKKKSQTAM